MFYNRSRQNVGDGFERPAIQERKQLNIYDVCKKHPTAWS
jgi:hypothetical protein